MTSLARLRPSMLSGRGVPMRCLVTIGQPRWASLTVKARSAGVWSLRPTASVARTRNVCWPNASSRVTSGVLHATNGSLSMLQVNVAAGSLDANAKAGRRSSVVSPGPALIVVSGAVVSTVKLRIAGVASVFVAGSVARTLKRCAPSLSIALANGVVHGVYAPSSMRHSNVDAGSLEENENVAAATPVSPAGPVSMVVSGATVSTVNDRVAGD